MSESARPSRPREPKQERTRQAWVRILDVGLALLLEGGAEALTVSEVCRRSGVSPPSLYARVDGRTGLFQAVYEHGMTAVRETQAALLAELPRPEADLREQAASAARVIAEVFRVHERLLRPIIVLASEDAQLRERGAVESQRFLVRLAESMPAAGERADDVARTLYAECVLRTVWGAGFLTGPPEAPSAFEERLARLAWRLAVPVTRPER